MMARFDHPKKSANAQRAGWFFSLIAWSLVAFYLLASARALIPGLCATQAAMDAQCHAVANQTLLQNVGHGCCAVPPARQDEGDKKDPVTPAESHCAFCNLLIAHTDPPLGFTMALPPEPVHADQVPLAFQVAQEASIAAAPNRAPPA